jgi:hypothetical protein
MTTTTQHPSKKNCDELKSLWFTINENPALSVMDMLIFLSKYKLLQVNGKTYAFVMSFDWAGYFTPNMDESLFHIFVEKTELLPDAIA